jgi:hypothetical protein
MCSRSPPSHSHAHTLSQAHALAPGQASYAARDALLSYWAFAVPHGGAWGPPAGPAAAAALVVAADALSLQPATLPKEVDAAADEVCP